MNKTKSIILNIIIIEITYLLFKIFETCFKIWELLQLEHFILWFNDGLIFLKQFKHIKCVEKEFWKEESGTNFKL